MNQNLQKITLFLRQAESLSAEEKASLSKAVADADKEMEITAFKLDRTEKVKRTTAILLEETIEELEHKRKAVEAQNHELEIESSLERVRTQAMSMNKPNDLMDICQIVYAELQLLGFHELRNAMINIYEDNKTYFLNYDYAPGSGKTVTRMPYNFHPLIDKQVRETKNAGDAFNEFSFTGKELKDFRELRKNNGERDDPKLEDSSSLHYYFYSIGTGSMGISTYSPITENKLELLKRFRNVFNLAYQRYIDITKAEAQAREAQIEVAIERVRAQSMAMHHPDDLDKVNKEILNQLTWLQVPGLTGVTFYLVDEHGWVKAWDFSSPGNLGAPNSYTLQFDSKKYDLIGEPFRILQQSDQDYFIMDYPIKKLERAVKELDEINPFVANAFKEAIAIGKLTHQWNSCARLSNGILGIDLVNSPTEDTKTIVLKMAGAFNMAYKRFLDLQKAEAQAREAQIQLAMERVRARTMAMQHSSELSQTSALLFQQIQALGVPPWSCGFNIWEQGDTVFTSYMGSPDGATLEGFKIPLTEEATFIHFQELRDRGDKLFIDVLEGETLEAHYRYFLSLPEIKKAFEKRAQAGEHHPTYQINHLANFSHGNLMFITYEPCPHAHDIFKRFAKVFEQTYTRFLDLQKAEAQAREAQIEVALERVRSRTMGMQKSEELAEVATILFQQVKAMGVPQWACGFNIWEIGDKDYTFYPGSPDGSILKPFRVPLTGHWVFSSMEESRKKGEDFFMYEKEGEKQEEHYRYMLSLPGGMGELLQNMLDAGMQIPKFQIDHLANFSHGNLMFITYEPVPEMWDVFKRFAKVFDQTYTRFLDLQKAEAQAREAVKQSSLDRVRGQIASMRTVDDLQRITPIIWHELIALGVPFVRCGVFIINESTAHVQVFLSAPDGKSLGALDLPFDSSELTINSVNHWRQGIIFRTHWNKQEFLNFMQSMIKEGQVQSPETYQGASKPPESLDLHFVPFAQGMLYVGNIHPLKKDELDLVKSLAEAFSIAYARYEDFKKLETAKQSIETTLSELKAAQSQLVQSEKMASLGELTAGIAHEIQNPLNFVNNFSEVSTELVDEMNDEIDKGNLGLAKEIASDLRQNLEKINHHGKRADAIVKGMLQHSRTSTGTKEPTDINKLADEYLRLAYHGLRAKDKSFNATMITDFDETIGNINIIPQDIGRVILNLITNAFYAVNEKNASTRSASQKLGKDLTGFENLSGLEGYEPTVWVGTKRTNDKVEVFVKDNGNGIPKIVIDKIFQPFFTTKPTGQGTGLGLSMSYDIVKAHGGELKVETKEGEGSEFIILIPII